MHNSTRIAPRFPTLCAFGTLIVILAACKHPTPGTLETASATENDTNDSAPPVSASDPTLPTTGITEGGGGEPVWEGCLGNGDGEHSAFRHQCAGSGTAKLHFNIVGLGGLNGPRTFTLPVSFGPGVEDDSYEEPKVMACCAPGYDDEEDMALQPHYMACYRDLADQACRSLWSQIKDIKDHDDTPALAKPQIQSLADFVGEHHLDCFTAMWAASGGVDHVPANATDFFTLDHTWVMGAGANTTNIEDVEFEIDNGTISDIFIPENDTTWGICRSTNDNNDFHFLEADPSDGYVFTLYYGDAELAGPGSPAYEGSAEFSSDNTSCTTSCSYLSTHDSEVGVWVDAMKLGTAEPAAVTNGTNSTTVDRARVALLHAVHATQVSTYVFEIDPGDAQFLVTGFSDGEASVETAYNATTITIDRSPPTLLDPVYQWTVSPFDLVYEDDNEDEWTLEIGTLFFSP